MAYLTFIHGIANKPPQDELLRQWQTALLVDDGVDLDDLEVSSSMVYWADLLYETPADPGGGHESNELELQQGLDAGDADLTWLDGVPQPERRLVEGLARHVGFADITASPDGTADPILSGSALESVPLPAPLKRRLMRVFLRDVHHFLFDVEYSPRPGESFHIRQEVRRRMLDALLTGAEHGKPHVVVGHSLGSVIAYDALTAVPGVPPVDALVTIGSPLGISEVQDGLTPPWTAHDGWPGARLGSGEWANFFDALDPVCGGADRFLAPDYQRAGAPCVSDVHVNNKGSWRHSIEKYLGQRPLRDWLERAIRVEQSDGDSNG
ncbi:MAG: hypothetical protein ACOYBY_16730 [Dermatophilaceae bacterium]